jgi:hypothetical protein
LVTKHFKLGNINNRTVFFIFIEDGKSKIKMSVISDEGLLSQRWYLPAMCSHGGCAKQKSEDSFAKVLFYL